MNIEELRDNCLAVRGSQESFPFDEDTVVFKVAGKMFAFAGLTPKNGEFLVSLKCNPERSAELREHYAGITKGYYCGNTLKWNSVFLESDVPDKLIKELIQHSADEVVKGLSRKAREEYFTD